MTARARRRAGFTLMETLVVLVLVSLTVLVMFQMLGSYRIARERTAAWAGDVDRRALMEAWFTDTVRGLHPVEQPPFRGDADGFGGVTLNPLRSAAGAPTPVGWRLVRGGEAGLELEYSEGGTRRWSLPLREDDARFVYFARDGRQADAWPPRQGMQDLIPGAIALVEGTRSTIVSVLGPVQPPRSTWDEQRE